jgi:hypothetical protein
MTTYSVTLPFTGVVVVEVEASSVIEAVKKAMKNATFDDIEQWETHTQIIKDNVFYGVQNLAEVEELGE